MIDNGLIFKDPHYFGDTQTKNTTTVQSNTMEGLGEGQQIVSGELGRTHRSGLQVCLEECLGVCWVRWRELVQRLCERVSGAATRHVRLHGGQGPLMEAKRHWYGNAGGAHSGWSSLIPDCKKHHRALMQAAAGIPLPGNPMEETDVLLSSFGSLGY